MEADHSRFAEALAALDRGDENALLRVLKEAPDLTRARVTTTDPPYEGYFHAATLLHHVAGNPVRGELPPNAPRMARILLAAGADPDAGCGGGPAQPDTKGGTVLALVMSGAQAHVQGLTADLVEVLLSHGATLDRQGGLFASLYHTVEHRGQRDVARMIHARGVEVDLPTAAGLGYPELVRSFLTDGGEPAPDADAIWRHCRGFDLGEPGTPEEVMADAVLAAAVNGWPEIVELLAGVGAPLNDLRPWGPFRVTPLHGAAWAGWPETVRCLLDLGADPGIRDPEFNTTAEGWARHCGRAEAIRVFEERT